MPEPPKTEKTLIDPPPAAPRDAAVRRYRSVGTPRVPVLIALDDFSKNQGEAFRLRTASTLIGRLRGQIRIAHDQDISSQHARIDRSVDGEDGPWKLYDESSTNGTFVRVDQFELGPSHELRLGAQLMIWNGAPLKNTGDGRLVIANDASRQWTLNRSRGAVIGRSRTADCCLGDDPCLNERHASLTCSSSGTWMISDLNSLNGVWVRISQWVLSDQSEFMLGSQRFRFCLPALETSQS